MTPLPRFAGPAIFLLAMSVLMLEVTLTRIFSVMMWYHFTYLVIGLALLGFGAAGTVLTVHPRFSGPALKSGVLSDCAWLFGLSGVVCFLAMTKISFDPTDIYNRGDFSQLVGLLMLLFLATVPLFFGGLGIGYLISKSGDQINRLYFCDLLGAGCGSLGALLAVNYMGATATLFWLGFVGCVVAMIVGGRADGRLRWRYPVTALVAAGLGAITLAKDSVVPVPFPASKISNYHGEEYRWHVVARVDVVGPKQDYPSFGGSLSRVWDRSRPRLDYMSLYQDGMAPTGIIKLQNRRPQDLAILGHYMQGCAFVLRPKADVLVIGPGGGVDVAMALHHGVLRVTAVDINPRTIEYVRDKYNDFAGGLYRREDVEVICAEGRHYLTTTERKFDVIQLSGVDTFTALASGAYALSENYLYTREAMRDYFDRLSEDGILSFSRWLFTPPRETLRLAVTARQALADRGIHEPGRHILVLAAPAWEGRPPWAETLIKLKPFTAQEVSVLRAWAEPLRFDVIYDPLVPHEPGGEYDRIEPAPQYGPAACAREFSAALRLPARDFADYVRRYPYNIKPATDDSPFFFNFYRPGSLLRPFAATLGGYGVTRLPLGLVILVASLVAIVVFGAVFILLPMRAQAGGLKGQRGGACVLVYFACLGLAFICVELMLLQKLMVFLGGPVYSMSVTLFSLLVFCGMGSFLAKGFTRSRPRLGAFFILLAVAAAIYGTTRLLHEVVPTLMWLSHPRRCLVAVAALLPVGLLMGMPFPTGIRMAERLNPRFVPWAWCVNACATVLGSVGCILAAMFVGFTAVLYAGAVMYLIALLALLLAPRAADPTAASDSPRTIDPRLEKRLVADPTRPDASPAAM